jgi:predicted RNase H-like nuclease (RuvC/YqgF family)
MTAEHRIEIAGLKAQVIRLQARAKEDAANAEHNLELEIHLATNRDVQELEAQIAKLKQKLVDEGCTIDRLIVVMTRETRKP